MLAVLPGQLGIGVFSPRLDARGNSVRGVAVCTDVSRDFNLHCFRVPRSAQAVIRAEWDLTALRSRRQRPEGERAVLDADGHRARVYALQGDLSFGAVEAVVRRVVDVSRSLTVVALDLRRVARTDGGAVTMLAELVASLVEVGTPLVLVGVESHGRFVRQLEEAMAAAHQGGAVQCFTNLDAALEWCEQRLLSARGADAEGVMLAEHDLTIGLSVADVVVLADRLQRVAFAAGDTIVNEGDRAEELFLLMRGRVSVTVDIPGGTRRRLATVSPGMVFGELTVVDRSPRTADVRADTAVECLVLPATALEELGSSHPQITMAIMRNLLRNVHRTVQRLSREVTALES